MRYHAAMQMLASVPSNFALSAHLFLQFAAILGACRVVGWLARRAGQPQVVGEMIAGVMLGPSLLGVLWPSGQTWLFPKSLQIGDQTIGHPLMTVLYCLAQIGLAMYMFLVGLEFRGDLLRQRARSAASVSIAGILAPFTLGCVIAWWFAGNAVLFHAGVRLPENMLFMGAAMSITAFPMLARIIHERGLTGTPLGTLALAAGSVDDVLAWCVLAVVLASFSGDPFLAVRAIGGGVLYSLLILTVVRRLLKGMGESAERGGDQGMPASRLAMILLLLMLASWFTDAIGIYAVFGAFVLGLAMPRGRLSELTTQRLESVVVNLLLPMFFVYSGLNTRITLIDSWTLWLVAGVILLAACAGKGLACYAAARGNGENKRDAVAIGALMNARGLMELIILNIGLEHGIVTPALFSIMVLMAIVTTLMATPIFEWALRGRGGMPRPSSERS